MSEDVFESHGIFNFSDDLFGATSSSKPPILTVSEYTPRQIYEGWFSTFTNPSDRQYLSIRKNHYDFLYWKGEYSRITESIAADIELFSDKNCILRREYIDCFIKCLIKVGRLEEALYWLEELLSLHVVDLGVRFVAAQTYFESFRLLPESLKQLGLYLKERPTVYQAWQLVAQVSFELGDFCVSEVAWERAQKIAAKYSVTLEKPHSADCFISSECNCISDEVFELLFGNCSRENFYTQPRGNFCYLLSDENENEIESALDL